VNACHKKCIGCLSEPCVIETRPLETADNNWLTLCIMCDFCLVNGDGSVTEEKEEDDRVRPVVKMRVKPSRTSEVETTVSSSSSFISPTTA